MSLGQGLGRTHFITNDASCPLCVELPEPLHACHERQSVLEVDGVHMSNSTSAVY